MARLTSSRPRTTAATPPAKERWRFHLWRNFGILIAVALVTAFVRAILQQDAPWYEWLFVPPPAAGELARQIASVLSPFLAVAVGIERFIETFFDTGEQALKGVSDIIEGVRPAVGWVENELLEAYGAVEALAQTDGVKKGDAQALEKLALAEERLVKAEERVANVVKDPKYLAWKRALSIWIGLLVGLEVAVLGDIGMLRAIGIPTPRILDMLVTGLVIGAGPGPMHSLLGILENGKGAIANLADLARGRELRESVEELKDKVEKIKP